MRHGFWVALFVLLALTFQKTTRVASICVLAAQVIVERHRSPTQILKFRCPAEAFIVVHNLLAAADKELMPVPPIASASDKRNAERHL